MIRAAHGLIALFWATGAAACGAQGSAMQSETPGAPELWVSFPEIPVAQPFGLSLLLCGDAPGTIEVDAIMPAHQHGMNYRPTVTDQGNGSFRVEGMVFHMPGIWELRVSVQRDDAVPSRYSQVIKVK